MFRGNQLLCGALRCINQLLPQTCHVTSNHRRVSIRFVSRCWGAVSAGLCGQLSVHSWAQWPVPWSWLGVSGHGLASGSWCAERCFLRPRLVQACRKGNGEHRGGSIWVWVYVGTDGRTATSEVPGAGGLPEFKGKKRDNQ